MRRFCSVVCLSLVALLLSCDAVHGAKPHRGKAISVLFIGNSYTYFHHLPQMVAGLATAGRAGRISVDMQAPGGYSFSMHFDNKKTLAKIKSRRWDVIVLQEQSQMPVMAPEQMHEFARKLHAAIKEKHNDTRVVFFLTWARENKPGMQKGLNKAYFKIAEELEAEVAPVGIAWQIAREKNPKLVLHQADKSHPTPTGSYLAACVLYATLYDKSPVGLPGRIGGISGLSNAAARPLQDAAWQAVQQAKKKMEEVSEEATAEPTHAK